MDFWNAIGFKEPYILACTGAGGKTSVLLSLVKEAQSHNIPVLLSTTTKMYYNQIIGLNPVFSDNFDEGETSVAFHLAHEGIASWFTRVEGDKVIGLPPRWLDRMIHSTKINPYILVEADGARGLWLKCSNINEPLVPVHTKVTVGVLNLQAIGQPLTNDIVHRLDLVLSLLQKKENQIVEWQDLALITLHKHGIFQYSQGEKILLLNGAITDQVNNARQIAEYLNKAKAGISKCIVTEGYGEVLRLIEVYDL
jgi:probable selenium-dependent hydroxylase accessory protein YqeC